MSKFKKLFTRPRITMLGEKMNFHKSLIEINNTTTWRTAGKFWATSSAVISKSLRGTMKKRAGIKLEDDT